MSAPVRGMKGLKSADPGTSRGVRGAGQANAIKLSAGCDGYVNPEESGKLLVLYRY